MAKRGQEMRKKSQQGKPLDLRVDKKNAAELKKIVARRGWPTISLVGKRANHNAWLLAQHADHDKEFQEKVLKLLIKINAEGSNVNRAHVAFLTDRLLVAKKKKQKFGTQFAFTKGGKLKLYALENAGIVDDLRKAYNLPPLREYIEAAREHNKHAKSGKRLVLHK